MTVVVDLDTAAIAPGTVLPPALDVPAACSLLSICSKAGYTLIRDNQFPVPVLHLGRSIRIPTQPLLDLLGLASHIDIAGPPPPQPTTG